MEGNRPTRRGLIQYVLGIGFLIIVVIFLQNYTTETITNGDVQPYYQRMKQMLYLDESKTIKEDPMEVMFRKRRETVLNACAAYREGSILGLFVDMPSKLAVCHTPKVGCTFWKRIMVYTHNVTGKHFDSPFEIDRYLVHHVASMSKYHYGLNNRSLKLVISNLTRVIFARDPYSRLWSAYVDKIILPDSWKDFGLGIYKYRKLGTGKCPYNIKFEDFLRFALYKHSDSHWAPLHTVCNPCIFFPQYIGKMETFGRDAAYVLNKTGLGHLLTQNHQDHVEDEIKLLIRYHFQIHEARAINKQCLSTTDLAARLWKVFQLNGYFDIESVFPKESIEKSLKGQNINEAKQKVTNIFLDFYEKNSRPKSVWKAQRKSVLESAYADIPLDIREDIRQKYAHDFNLYGYEAYPKHIFPERY